MIKLRFKRIRALKLDEIILTILLLQVMVICWISLDLQDVFNHLLVVLIVVSCLRHKKFVTSPLFGAMLLFVGYQFINFLILGGHFSCFMRNWYRTFKSILIIVYFSELVKNEGDLVSSFLVKCLKLFNIYALINIPILLSQRLYSKDMMSGLFGLYGTPRLAVFIAFLVMFNFVANRVFVQQKSITFEVYNVLLLAFYLWMATQNDNKGFYIILVLFAFITYVSFYEGRIISNTKRAQKKRIWILLFRATLIIVLIFSLGVIAYKTSDLFKETVDEAVLKIREGFLIPSYLSYNKVTGGGERFAMILFALSRVDTAVIGFGLGNYLYTSGNLGFQHFGQADVGTFICLGGSLYIVLMFLVVYLALKRNLRKSIIPPIMLIAFFILSCYTHVLMDTGITIPLCWFYIIIWISYEMRKTENNGAFLEVRN